MRPMASTSMSTIARSTATSKGSARSSRRSTWISPRSKPSMPSATDTATAEPGSPSGPALDRTTYLRRGNSGRRWPISPLTRRILAVNVLALALLAGGFLYLGKYQASLVGQQIESLKTQGEVFAAALGEGAVLDSVDEGEILLPDLARQMMRRLVEPTRARARLFDIKGDIIADSRVLRGPGDTVQVLELPGPETAGPIMRFADRVYDWIVGKLPRRSRYPVYRETAAASRGLPRGDAGAARRDRLRDPQRPDNRGSRTQRGHPGSALQAGAGRGHAVDRQRRDRGGSTHGAARAAADLQRGASGHRAALVLPRRHDRAPDPPLGRRGRARARPPRPGRDPGFHPAGR